MEHKSYNGLTEPEVQQNRLKFGTNENTQVSQKIMAPHFRYY